MSIGIHMDTSSIPVSIAGTPVTDSASASSADATSGARVNVQGGSIKSPANSTAASGGGSDSSTSAASPTVQALLREIKQLRKMLAQQQQQLRAATSGPQAKDPANLTRVTSLQAAMATTMGQLESAVSALSAALLAEGSASSGNLVSASA